MQVYAKSNRLTLKLILFFAAVIFLALLPVSSFMFFLKNDAFTGYFPPKFFMSESLHAGYLPLWNPYINFGVPQYGDMSSGYWSPVTWLIAATCGYTAYTFTIELLFYLLIGGLGFYKLTQLYSLNKYVPIIAATAFMCSGYSIGHLQHFNWISGAAFLPWCWWSYGLLISNFSLKNAVRAALLFYLLVASAHPGITIGAIYFFIAMGIFYFYQHSETGSLVKRIKNTLITHAVFLLLLFILSAGLVAGFLDIIPWMVRGEKNSLADGLSGNASFQTWISTILPFTTVKNDALFNTDISMRNSYFSMALLIFFINACIGKKDALQKMLLVTGLLFALLASGGIFKIFAHQFIPLIDYVRLNGEFRIFSLLCFIMIAAIELNKFISASAKFQGTLTFIYYFIEIAIIISIAYGIYMVSKTGDGFLYHFSNALTQPSSGDKLKKIVDSISPYDTFWMQGIVQLLVLWSIKWCLKTSRWKLLAIVVVVDIILASLFNVPFTGSGKASVATVQQIINRSPDGIPIPVVDPIDTTKFFSAAEQAMAGPESFYNKQLNLQEEAFYPIALKNMRRYFELPSAKRPYSDSPYLFLLNNRGSITVNHYTPNSIDIMVTNTASEVIFKQNYYHHWYYETKGIRKPVELAGINFMKIPVENGTSRIKIIFAPAKIKQWMLLSLIALIVYCFVLTVIAIKQFYLSKPRQ